MDPKEIEDLEEGKEYVIKLFKLLDSWDRDINRTHPIKKHGGVESGFSYGDDIGDEEADENEESPFT